MCFNFVRTWYPLTHLLIRIIDKPEGGFMLRKMIILICVMFHQVALAETCPSIDMLKDQHFNAWKFYDTDDGKLLSAKRIAQFKKEAEEFVLAESVTNSQHKKIIRCYYHDKNGSTLNAYIAKENFIVGSNHSYWYEVSHATQCAADINMCEFQQSTLQQLARN